MKDEALKLALEALEGIQRYGLDTLSGRVDGPDDREWQRAGVNEMTKRARLGITAIKEALAQPEQEPVAVKHMMENAQGDLERIKLVQTGVGISKPEQEPVAWMSDVGSVASAHEKKMGYVLESAFTNPLYTTPPQRTWVGLTDVEWMNIVNKDQAWFGQRPDEVAHEVAKLVEAKLKEKNNV